MSIRISLQCTYNFMDYLKKKKRLNHEIWYSTNIDEYSVPYEKSSLVYNYVVMKIAPY